MVFFKRKHNFNLYSTLLNLSRNIFFYQKVELEDKFETRIYLMFFHFSIIMLVFKKKGKKFDQDNYDFLFHAIENDLRELGFGDVSVNKKMKEFNKILYDILVKVDATDIDKKTFKINRNILIKYFDKLKTSKNENLSIIERYFDIFFNFCFEQTDDNMIHNLSKFKF
tara:strand:+ start:4754 stop:5257 length:504 start_codon:yes stop_codon:yes gene_type:complete